MPDCSTEDFFKKNIKKTSKNLHSNKNCYTFAMKSELK